MGPASVLRSLGKQWSSGCCSAAPPPPPAAPPPRPGARRQLARSPLRALVPGRVTAASRPTSSAPIGCRSPLQRRAVASGPGRGGAVAAPSRAGKGAGDAAKSPTGRHLPARPPRREPRGGRRRSPARAVTRGVAVPRRGAAGKCGEWGRRRRDERPKRTCCLLAGQPMVGVAVSFLEIKACPGSSVFGRRREGAVRSGRGKRTGPVRAEAGVPRLRRALTRCPRQPALAGPKANCGVPSGSSREAHHPVPPRPTGAAVPPARPA